MTSQIRARDIANWDSLSDIADSLEKRDLERQDDLGDSNEIVLQLSDDEFIKLVEAGPGEHAQDFKPESMTQHTNFVATNDFEDFTFITRVRTWDQEHGRIKYQKFSFSKNQFTRKSGEKRTVLEKLNSIEYGNPATIYDNIYDTRKVVKEFYQQFEDLRNKLVQEVAGIPEDRGDAKQRYVQVILDRMIFLYFIQEKRLLDHDKDYLRKKHDEFAKDGDVYGDFYHDLFFEALAEGTPSKKYENVPYLNGGLFSKNPVEEEFEDAKLGETVDKTNACFDEILDFLSDWNWNVDERLDIVDPKNLSPAVLGHIFEQTVNQKEMGAYYTSEEITGFMARQTVQPYLLDELNEKVGAEYEELDELFGFRSADADSEGEVAADGGTITTQAPTEQITQDHVGTLYFDVLKELRVLDPAVGSGAFLLAAQEVLLDVYMQCIEYFQVREDSQPWELTDRIKEELEAIEGRKGSASLYAKREVILNNLYGVDVDDGAVEICKLRLWLSMVADIEDDPDEVEKLPNIDFNIRQGNSLIGYVESLNPSKQGKTTWDDWNIRDKYQEVIQAVQKHRKSDSSANAENWRKLAEERMAQYRPDFDHQLVEDLEEAEMEDLSVSEVRSFSAFHWILEFAEVWDEGRFDVVIGNPPWEVLSPNRDDFFSRYDERFRTYTSDYKDEAQEELLEKDKIKSEWNEYQKSMERAAEYFNKSPDYELQSPQVAGRTVASENDLSALFLERVFNLIGEKSRVSLILPGFVFSGAIAKDLRQYLLDETTLSEIVGFENKGIFEDIDDRYRFGIIDFKKTGESRALNGIFSQQSTDVLFSLEESAATIPKRVLSNFSPEAGIFPSITSQREADVLDAILDHEPLAETMDDAWNVKVLTKELHEPSDSHRFVDSENQRDYPVYGGENIHQFKYDNKVGNSIKTPHYWSRNFYDPEKSAKYRIREKKFNKGNLKKALYEAFDGDETSKSQVQFVDELLEEKRGESLAEEDVLLDCNEYRIAYRDITNSTNERTMIATVLPKDFVCLHTLQTVKPYTINPTKDDLKDFPLHSAYERTFEDRELFIAVGLLNSIPFDFLMRTKVDTHIVKYKFLESQIPRLTEGDEWFNYISERAARLNCYGDEFEEMRERLGGIEPATDKQERRELQAEIDAAAFHAYGLDTKEVKFILDDFHRVKDPQMMDEEYFDMVFENYDSLNMEGTME